MTADYIWSTYSEARQKADAARALYLSTTSKAVKREAGDDLEFWSNKAASMWAAARHYGIALEAA